LGENTSSFTTGGGGNFAVDLDISSIPLVFLRTELDYEFVPFITKDGLSVFSFSAGGGLKYPLFDKLTLAAFGTGGYYFASMTGDTSSSGGNLILSAGVSANYNISESFSLGLSAAYTYKASIYGGLGLSIGTTIYPEHIGSGNNQYGSSIDLLEALSPGVSGKGLDVDTISFNQIFPVLFKHYDSNPVGNVKLFNNESSPITDIFLSFFVDRYMDNPKQSPVIEKIDSKSSANFDIYALFSDSVLDITEGTKVSANVIIKYTQKGKEYARKYVASMDMYDRNAITWDDDRKAAAFVTAKDPAVLEFAKNISGWIKPIRPTTIDKNLCIAMGMHNALNQYGITYQIDPKTPFTEFSENTLSVDFLQFPRQTLQYTSGDCDDLSILYSALLEAVGVETAFVTVPGHIYMAFSLNMAPAEAKRAFLKPDDLIFIEDKVWLPVEITMVQDNFLAAWAMGAKEWRENAGKGQAKIYPMHESWDEYKPVGLPGSTTVVTPLKGDIVSAFESEMASFIDKEIYPQVEKLEAQISRNNGASRYVNRLGVLYARYGLNDKAAGQFQKILRNNEFVPALINMGNISFLNEEIKEALQYYERAVEKDPDNPKALLSVARAAHELENYGTVRESFEKLKTIDSGLAERFAYLDLRGDEAARAAEVSEITEVVVWDEE
ncbi:MAG: tetratricopeptide repeat protein, partial [Spirochaetota bacterium]|nr:tetratricopeptide repeat protein [Spirochaetota bacterium]